LGEEIALNNYIERKPNSEKYRIVGKGVTVEFLSTFIDDPAWTVEEICVNYGLTPAEIYAAWSFYHDHKAEIDARLEESHTRYNAHRAEDQTRRETLVKRRQSLA
jgi:uncharacterized protein (DUF433 family)